MGDADVVAIVMGESPGAREAAGLLAERDLAALARLPAPEIHAIDTGTAETAGGVRTSGRPAGDRWPAVRRLAAAFELGRRVERATTGPHPLLRSPGSVAATVAPRLRGLAQETFLALLLDGKHRLRRTYVVSTGTLTTSLVHPREVFGPALRIGAAAVVAVHNHPSGDPEPSGEDLQVTRRLVAVGRLVGIPLIDHVVVADGTFCSLRERMDFDADWHASEVEPRRSPSRSEFG